MLSFVIVGKTKMRSTGKQVNLDYEFNLLWLRFCLSLLNNIELLAFWLLQVRYLRIVFLNIINWKQTAPSTAKCILTELFVLAFSKWHKYFFVNCHYLNNFQKEVVKRSHINCNLILTISINVSIVFCITYTLFHPHQYASSSLSIWRRSSDGLYTLPGSIPSQGHRQYKKNWNQF